MHRRSLARGLRSVFALGSLVLAALGPLPLAAEARPVSLPSTQFCPTDLPLLVPQLLADLPSYANRVASRTLSVDRLLSEPRTTLLTTSPADLTPLDPAELMPGGGVSRGDSALQQVFFTTLERQFWPDRVVSLQHHHWLFLAQSPEGWHLALLYSSVDTLSGRASGATSGTGPATAGRGPTPPQEASDGIVGQAVRLWLRDCQAGAVFSDRPATRSPVEGTVP